MSLKERIMEEIKSSMKEKNQARLDTLRFLHSAIKNKEIEIRPTELTDADITQVIQKSVKQRRESIEQYQKGGRPELADKEVFEVKVLEEFLPTQMNEAEVKELVTAAIKSLGAKSVKEMGAVMKEVTARAQGRADNRLISQIVKSSLSS